MVEFVPTETASRMQLFTEDLDRQATQCHMNVNDKTKEIINVLIRKNPPLPITLLGTVIERLTMLMLLDVHISDDLNWMQHVSALS